ncbi:MAG: type II secretion system protein [Sulfurovum sp.]|nr:type II secretion system protein [Sulfurovum sp.]
MKRKAFTMIELVLVIVVLGILSALAMPRLDRDLEQEAADNILSAIRYTQHMALIDNKHDANTTQWQKAFWQIQFAPCSDGKFFYRVGADHNMDSGSTFEKPEAATDPMNGKPMYMNNGGDCSATDFSPNILIGKKYGLTSITGTGGCADRQYIGFDYLGRPQQVFSTSSEPNYSSYMSTNCTFTFSSDSGSFDDFAIIIEKETGYAYIVGQEDS